MHEITYDKFCLFIQENIVNDEKGMEIIKEFLLDNFDGSSDELVKATIEPSVLFGESNNLFIPNCNIYINLKKLTVLVLACICDIYITKGAATALGVALGKINSCIYKLDIDDCCIFSRILFYSTVCDGVSEENLINDYSGKCSCKANKRCPYFESDCICRINEINCISTINKLIINGVVEMKDSLIYIS